MANSVYDPENEGRHRQHPSNPDQLDNQAAEDPSDPRTTHNNPRTELQKAESGAAPGSGSSGSFNFNPKGDTGNRDNGGNFNFNADGDGKKGGVAAAGLAAAELTVGGGAAGAATSVAGRAKNFFWGSKKRKQLTIGGGVTGTLVSGGVFVLIILSGPAQLVQLSQVLQKNFANMDNASALRTNKLLGFAGAQSFEETRIGVLERQTFRKQVVRLNDIGIEFKTNATGSIVETTIDTAKLLDKYPELQTKTVDERKTWLAERFGMPPEQVKLVGGGTFSINARDFPFKATRLLIGDSVSLLGKGGLSNAIANRTLTKAFGAPSIFHPMKRAEEKVLKKLTPPERVVAVREEQAKIDDPIEAKGDAAEKGIRDSANKYNSIAMKTLMFTGGVCFMKEVAHLIPIVNQTRVVGPSAVNAAVAVGTGDQVRSNQDYTLTQVGARTDSLKNKEGESVWGGKALQVTGGNRNPKGEDIPLDLKQAYSTDPTIIEEWANSSLVGGGLIADAACSPIGQGAQILAGVALSLGSVWGEIASGGTLTPAIAGIWTAKQGASFTVSAVAMHFLQSFIVNSQTSGKLAKDAFSGPLGGNLLAYGAREMANIGARSQGAIPLAGSTSALLAEQNQKADEQQFRSESFITRTFDVNDSRSLTGKLATTVSPDYATNVTSAAQGFGSIGKNLLSNLASIFVPRSQAAEQRYDWGFPEYSIPPELLDDPELASPPGNADKVAVLLDSPSGQGLIDKAKVCFGDEVSKDSGAWDVQHTSDPNPNSEEFIGASCGDLGDGNWRKMIMFVFDTTTAQAMACYLGDNESCTILGFGSSNSSNDGASNPAIISGEPRELAKALIDSGRLTDEDGRYMAQIQAVANGNSSCNINPDILKMLYGVVVEEKHSVKMSSLNRYCTGVLTDSGPASYHYREGGGHAVDVVAFDDAGVNGTHEASTLGYLNAAIKYLPANTGIGQVESCGSGFKIPSDDYPVPDACTHEHIQVPVKQLK
jgi:hypothetical protein